MINKNFIGRNLILNKEGYSIFKEHIYEKYLQYNYPNKLDQLEIYCHSIETGDFPTCYNINVIYRGIVIHRCLLHMDYIQAYDLDEILYNLTILEKIWKK